MHDEPQDTPAKDVEMCRHGAECRQMRQGTCKFKHPVLRGALGADDNNPPTTDVAYVNLCEVVDARKPKARLPRMRLTPKEALWFRNNWDVAFEATPPDDRTPVSQHPHINLAMQRAEAEAWVHGEVRQSLVFDVGGNPVRNKHQGREWWACCPQLSAADVHRAKRNTAELGSPSMANRYCEHTMQECLCVANGAEVGDYVLFSHSHYYIGLDDIYRAVNRTKNKVGFIITQEFDDAAGTFSGPHGIEARYRPSDDDPSHIIMEVEGNNHPYVHPRPDFLRAGSHVMGDNMVTFTFKRHFGHVRSGRTAIYQCDIGKATPDALARAKYVSAKALATTGKLYGPVDVTSPIMRANLTEGAAEMQIVPVPNVYAVGNTFITTESKRSVVVSRDLIAAASVVAVGTDRTKGTTFQNVLATVKIKAKGLNIPAKDQALSILWAAAIGTTANVSDELAVQRMIVREKQVQDDAAKLTALMNNGVSRDVAKTLVRNRWWILFTALLLVASVIYGMRVIKQRDAAEAENNRLACLAERTFYENAFGYTSDACNVTGWFMRSGEARNTADFYANLVRFGGTVLNASATVYNATREFALPYCIEWPLLDIAFGCQHALLAKSHDHDRGATLRRFAAETYDEDCLISLFLFVTFFAFMCAITTPCEELAA